MIYRMYVVVADPDTPEGKSTSIGYDLICDFSYNPQAYGNGHYVSIKTKDKKFNNCYDLRYDKSFNKNEKQTWLIRWANNYWSGKNGAYEVKSIKIEKIK